MIYAHFSAFKCSLPVTNRNRDYLQAYSDDRWFWEIFDLSNKLILTSIVSFVPATYELPINMCLLVLYLAMILFFRPYIRKGDDRFHLLVQTELFLLAFVGFILQQEGVQTAEMDLLLSMVLIGITVFLVISFIVIAGRNVTKLVAHAKYKKERNALAALDKAAGTLMDEDDEYEDADADDVGADTHEPATPALPSNLPPV